MTTYIDDTDIETDRSASLVARPTTYNPISVCKSYVERSKAAGHDVELTEYPNASHAFDNPLGTQPAAVSPKFEAWAIAELRRSLEEF